MLEYIKKSLITRQFAEIPEDVKAESNCGICIMDFEAANDNDPELEIKETPQCQHLFHALCIVKWVDSNIQKLKHPDCPMCRAEFMPEKKPPAVALQESEQSSNRIAVNVSELMLMVPG